MRPLRASIARPLPVALASWLGGAGLAVTVLAPLAGAQDALLPGGPSRIDPGQIHGKAVVQPKSIRVGGNEVYRLHLADSGSACGAWTATTGPLHEAGSNLNVLYGNGNPSTSDTVLRSWTSGKLYRTGPWSGGGCEAICDADPGGGVTTDIRTGPLRTGFRTTWTLADGGNTIELVQEIDVDGPVDGTQDVDNSVIRETHVVRNLGPGVLRFGLRKHWDWQIGDDDGPWYATCDHVDAACDRSMELRADGGGDGPYPPNYVMNEDPATALCPSGDPVYPDGCGGHPVYIVAGTVAPPSSLSPPPDAPEALQFNSWPRLVDSCWRPTLDDYCRCGAWQSSGRDDTAIAYFWGMTSATALVLQPGEEKSLTQYVVAAREHCPPQVEPPELSCDAGGPYWEACTGGTTSLALDATGASEGGSPTFAWTTDCPGGSFDDSAVEDPVLTVDAPDCLLECSVTLTVSEGSESTTCTAEIHVFDSTAPVPSCPAPLTIECRDGGVRRDDAEVASWLARATASDECSSAQISDDMPDVVTLSGCAESLPVTFVAVDACGNRASCASSLVVVDRVAPVLDVPAELTVECGAPGIDATKAAWLQAASAHDACRGSLAVGAPRLVDSAASCGGVTQTWEWTVADDCGNASADRSRWIEVDGTAPSLSGVPADATAECEPPPAPPVTASDDCDPSPRVEVDEQRIDGACGQEYRVVRTWTATDACGNTTVGRQVVDVVDTSGPTLSATPPDATVECDAVPPPPSVTASDACDPDVPVTFTETSSPGRCPQEITLTRTWTAADDCGNSVTRSQVLAVVDTRAPDLSGVPASATVECDAIPPPASVTASDACDASVSVDFVETRAAGRCPQEATITRTWTATDDCGNATSRAQFLTVVDTHAPTLSSVPANATVECDAIPSPASVTASDACDPSVSVEFVETQGPGRCPQEATITRTWTATDDCGNAASRTQVLSVVDTHAPTLAGVPADATVECDAIPSPASVTASDACDPSVSVEFVETQGPGRCPQEATITRTWTATDDCGNVASRTQVLSVVDTHAPTLAGIPADATVECDAVPPPATVTASDACDASVPVDFVETQGPGRCPQEATITRTWRAADDCGNVASRVQVLLVVDTHAPALSGVPSDATVECGAVPPPASVTAIDACDADVPVTLSETIAAGRCPQEATITRTWTASDDCGNAVTRTQVVRVVDTRAPVLSGVPADATAECDAIPPPPTVLATDACDADVPVALVETSAAGRCPQESFLTRTWTAADDCGNTVSRAQVITVVDTHAPRLVGVPGDETVECDAVPPPASPGAVDACDPAPRVDFAERRADGRCPNEYRLTRTWTATDACGNASSESQELTVVDTGAPRVQPPEDLTVECPAPPSGPQSESEWAASATATDTCGPAGALARLVSRAPGCAGTWTSTWEFWAVDLCGNESARLERTYEVVDTTPPILAAPDDATVECPAPGSGPGSEAEWLASASASDTCGSASVQSRLLADEPGCGGTRRRVHELWALDECGNESSRVVRAYEVIDTTAPSFDVAGDQFRLSLWPPNHGYVVYATAEVVSAHDACGTVTLRAVGCSSSQPEDVHRGQADDGGNGDGHTVEDCVVSVDGSQFAVRAERLGACGADSVRSYAVAFSATDECGNETPGTGLVTVEHDRSGHQDVRPGRKLGPNDPPPFPYLHPTTYGPECR